MLTCSRAAAAARLACRGVRAQQPTHVSRSLPVGSSGARRSMTAAAGSGGGGSSSTEAPVVQHMSVNELRELLSNPVLCEEVQFVDVREPWEHSTAKLPHFKLFPLSDSGSWAPTIDDTLDPQTETVVLCHHGMRSMQMAGFLLSRGFTNVKNVTGGIAAYSMVDRSIPEY